jgi:hypothetical protein
MRVRFLNPPNDQSYRCFHDRIGTIVNPEAAVYNNGTVYASVRFDMQHGYKKGMVVPADRLVIETSGETQYELRHYDLNYLTHGDIALLRDVLGADMREEAAKLLKRLPRLP